MADPSVGVASDSGDWIRASASECCVNSARVSLDNQLVPSDPLDSKGPSYIPIPIPQLSSY